MGCWRLKIYIVRHGETNGNLRGALQGWMDELLNEKGRELAIITARALSDIKFDVAMLASGDFNHPEPLKIDQF